MDDFVRIRAGEVGRKGDVKRDRVHAIALIEGIQGRRRQRTFDGWVRGVGIAIEVLASHPEGGRSHLLPAMASLAGEVAQLLHLEDGR